MDDIIGCVDRSFGLMTIKKQIGKYCLKNLSQNPDKLFTIKLPGNKVDIVNVCGFKWYYEIDLLLIKRYNVDINLIIVL